MGSRFLLPLTLLASGCLTSSKEYQELWDRTLDGDQDGFVNAEYPQYDGDDCDDTEPSVYPNAPELCDALDNDCDEDIDEGRLDWMGLYRDLDADGYGDPDNPVTQCPVPADAVDNTGDCDDTLPAINSAQTDVVGDGLDQNCDGVDGTDLDGDGYASVASGGEDCEDSEALAYPGGVETWYDGVDGDCDGGSDFDADADGFDAGPEGEDCDDSNPSVHPGGDDSWYDGVDGDCDGASDYDADLDGYDSDAYGGEDCDDADAGRSPAAAEVWYDGSDQDCDGASDYDADQDGYNSDAHGGLDCDDASSATSPNAPEVWYDGVDADCDGESDFDSDGDGYDSDLYGGADCDDTTSGIRPGVGETWYDGVDANCDGLSDFDADVDGQDSDAYGGADCDDRDPSTYSGADEYCDGVDSDCNGTIDDDYALNALSWYADLDGDGFGDPGNATTSCSQPSGYDSDNTDCDDTERAVNPNANEVAYDVHDNDCDGQTDEALVSDVASGSVYGVGVREYLAQAIVPHPDLDGDGNPDLVVASGEASWSTNYEGAIYLFDSSIVGGSRQATSAHSHISGSFSSMGLGTSVVTLGDCDGDGADELMLGADHVGSGGFETGAAYIVDFGINSAHTGGQSTLTPDVIIEGNNGFAFGSALSTGDTDGDGNIDVAWGATTPSSTRGYMGVMEGSGGFCTTSDVMDSLSEVLMSSSSTQVGLGTAVDNESDLSGDGVADVVACGPLTANGDGACWLVDWSNLATSGSLRITDYHYAAIIGQSADSLGETQYALATADVDADSQADLLIGAPGANSGDGAVYIFFGGANLTGTLSTVSADITITGDGALGAAIHVGDDVDGDGQEDLLLGAPDGGDNTQGALYLLPGPLTSGSYSLPDDQAASWLGEASGDGLGSTIGGLIDLDGDGQEEFTVAAPGWDTQGIDKGIVYVVPAY